MTVVLSLDAGTTSVRTIAVNELGSVVDSAQEEFPQYFPQPGWVEHDAEEIWAAASSTLSLVAQRQVSRGTPIAALGITNQRETVVAWDVSTSLPRHRAIVWQDRRTALRCEGLTSEGFLDEVRSRTGLVLDPYFSATKFEWLLTEGGVATDDNLRLGTVDAWLLWKLTGGAVHATEPSNASRTMLFDLRTGEWSPDLCAKFSVPKAALPEIQPTSGRFGLTTKDGPLPAGVPVSGIAGDQQAALFGQACFTTGETKNTYGTGSFVLTNLGPKLPPPVDGLLNTVAWRLGDPGAMTYALEGSIFATGATVQWLRDELGFISDAAEVGPLAESVEDSAGVVLVPAFTGLGSPWWDARARGTIVGLTRGAGRAELARAAVEAMAFQTRDVVEAMAAAGAQPLTELKVDGGATTMKILLRLLADQLGVPITRSATTETTALGAAFFAGLAEEVWSSTDELAKLWRGDLTVEPPTDRRVADASYKRWLEAVKRSREWITD